MRILFLTEGDAQSWDCWSGTSKSLVDQLRAAGHTVEARDVDLYGKDRLLGAALTFSPNRRRWGTRFHLGASSFRLRSRNAGRHIAGQRGTVDVILQIGATFEPLDRGGLPYFMYCDSNIRMAEHGATSGYSDAVSLSPRELEHVAQRELTVYRQASGIFTLSERLRRSFIEDFGLPPERVHAVHAGPNFDAAPILREPPRDDSYRAPTILFVGRQFHRKGGDLLVEAFRRVRERLPQALLLIAGPQDPPAQGTGISCLGDLDKNDPIGWAALQAAYRSADVFCLPTRFEPFGIAFIEAMCFGLPCVGTAAWAVPEMVVDGETGYTIPVDDVDALTDRLLTLLSDSTLARAMGQAGRARVEQHFTWQRVVERMTAAMTPVFGLQKVG